MVNWLYNRIRRGKTLVEGDTLRVEEVEYVDASGATVQAKAVEVGGDRVDRLYRYEFPEVDISGTAATLVGPIFPVAGTVLRAYQVVTEAVANSTITTATIALGTAGADGSTGADVDAVVDEIPLVKAAAVGTVTALTIVDGAIAAGEVLTASHVAQEIDGKVKIVVEYTLG
ncbi:MAG: hypothetical protein WC277_02140 [Bacilli bacterium]|jgi:hypothetical protein